MESPQITNALIKNTFLGWEDHGIFTVYLHLGFESGGQSFGGYALDNFDHKKDIRVGTAYGMDFIMGILNALELREWETVKGQYCRILHTHSRVMRIGHLIKDKWFDPEVEKYKSL